MLDRQQVTLTVLLRCWSIGIVTLQVNHPDIVLVQGPEVLSKHAFSAILEILIPHIRSKDAADAHMLGGHLGNMLIRLIY